MTKKHDNVTEAIDIIFKMRGDSCMDEEEAKILLDIIFSGQMDQETFKMIKFIYKVRSYDDTCPSKDENDLYWETVLNPSNCQNGRMLLDILLEDREGDEE